MPRAAKTVCRYPGCGRTCHGGYCDRHKDQAKQQAAARDQRRGSSAQRGYGYKWQQARLDHLAKEPFCVDCLEEGVATLATVVDHDPPHKGDMKKFWNRLFWKSRCERHHNIKTATEDGGFGRPVHPRG